MSSTKLSKLVIFFISILSCKIETNQRPVLVFRLSLFSINIPDFKLSYFCRHTINPSRYQHANSHYWSQYVNVLSYENLKMYDDNFLAGPYGT